MERKSHDSQRTAGPEAEAKSLGQLKRRKKKLQQPKTVHHSENNFISEPQHLSQTTSCIACFLSSMSQPLYIPGSHLSPTLEIKKPEYVAIAGAGRARHAVRECSMERSCATSRSNALTRPNTCKSEMNQNIRVCTIQKHTHIEIYIYIYVQNMNAYRKTDRWIGG